MWNPTILLEGLIQYAVLLFSLSVHESAHAWTANRFGDPTARYLGRISLNPVSHADLLGTVIFPLIMIFSSIPLIGWAKPVPVNPRNLRRPRIARRAIHRIHERRLLDLPAKRVLTPPTTNDQNLHGRERIRPPDDPKAIPATRPVRTV